MFPILMLALYIRIMTYNMRGVEDLLVCFLAMSGGDLLALLNVLCVHDSLTEMLWNLVSLSLGDLVALLVLHVMAFRTSIVSMMSVPPINCLTFVMVAQMV